MNERREPLVEDEPRHKKKSQSKGTPRSKHKHIYETVLLCRIYRYRDLTKANTPQKSSYSFSPTKVCTICGRIGYRDEDPSYYKTVPTPEIPWISGKKELTDRARELPLWCAEDFFDKAAEEIKNESLRSLILGQI